MGIPHSHLDRFMAHEFRDGTKINSGHHQTAGKTMSQAVPRKVLDPGLADCWIKPVLVACERFPMNSNKTRPTPRERVNNFCRAPRAMLFKGACLVFPFLLCGIVIWRRAHIMPGILNIIDKRKL